MIRAPPAGSPPLRPQLFGESCPAIVADLIAECWAESPASRPSIDVVLKGIQKAFGGHKYARL